MNKNRSIYSQFCASSVKTNMDEEIKSDSANQIKLQLDDAVRNGYIREITINDDWCSFRHPDYEFDSPSFQEGRFNGPGEIAFYAASGDGCGKLEVKNYDEKVYCGVKSHNINVFDMPAFSAAYNLNDAFVKQRDDGGWEVCQEVSKYLTEKYDVSGILYQSAACYKAGKTGICIAVLPGREQTLTSGFFFQKCGNVKYENGGQSAGGPDSE